MMFRVMPESALVYILWLGLYYDSYRYPLQINSTATSGHYSDTPFVLQALKYAIFMALLASALGASAIRRAKAVKQLRLSRGHAVYLLVFCYLFICPFLVALLNKKAFLVGETGIFFLLPATAILFDWDGELLWKRLGRTFDVFIASAVLYSAVQAYLYLAYGRLPALSWGLQSVARFGSVWDDPNGFAIMTSCLMGFSFYRYAGLRRLVVLSLLVLILFLTLSVTGIFSFIASCAAIVCMVLAEALRKPGKGDTAPVRWIAAFLALAAAAYVAADRGGGISSLMSSKTMSAQEHLESLRMFGNLGVPEMAVGVGSLAADFEETAEIGWINLAGNLGIVYTALYLAVLVAFISKALRLRKTIGRADRTRMPVVAGILLFLITALVGMAGLPLGGVFPINLLVCYFISVLIVMEKSGTSEPAR